jgi:hypothetical protein
VPHLRNRDLDYDLTIKSRLSRLSTFDLVDKIW